MRIDRDRLVRFCTSETDWYTLYIPANELALISFGIVRKQEDILICLLTEHTDRFYKALKNAYEGQFDEAVYIDADHGSMLKLYQFEIDNDDDGLAYRAKLEVLKKLVAAGKLGEASAWNAPHMVAISFSQHLYYPLFGFENDADKQLVPLKLRPLGLGAESEIQFVRDLEAFYGSADGKRVIGSRSLYLLRNAASEDKGLGFALSGNFYPDFLLWLVDDATGKQWLTFIDPKGLRNVDLNHPKLGLYKQVKELEPSLMKLGDAPLVLNAFILSYTSFCDLLNVHSTTKKADLEQRHVLFMEDGGSSYLQEMFSVLS